MKKAREARETASKAGNPKAAAAAANEYMFFPRRVAEKFEKHLDDVWFREGGAPPIGVRPGLIQKCPTSVKKFFADKRVKDVCMVTMPFVLFWGCGMIFTLPIDYLVKLGLFVVLYIYTNVLNEFVFDERLFNVLPISIYFANKFFFYITWLTQVRNHFQKSVDIF